MTTQHKLLPQPIVSAIQTLPPPVVLLPSPAASPVVAPEAIQVTLVPENGFTAPPERKYTSMNDTSYQPIGFLYNRQDLTMKLFARRKYPRGDRWLYFVIDKNGVKIPFSTKNEQEIYDGDSVIVPEFTDLLTAKIYDNQDVVYNPLQF